MVPQKAQRNTEGEPGRLPLPLRDHPQQGSGRKGVHRLAARRARNRIRKAYQHLTGTILLYIYRY